MAQTRPFDLLIATHNPGKILEIQRTLAELAIRLRLLKEFPNLGDVPETGDSYAANAIIKATTYSQMTGLWAVADDSGLEVDALGGGPGIFSARFGGEGLSQRQQINLLLTRVVETGSEDRSARFVCVMAIANPEVIHVARGECKGTITGAPRGESGFGFDPIFVPDGYESTFGELSPEIKESVSHRAIALSDIRQFLRNWLKLDAKDRGP
jgi:XTP/dITP diphosphohydrolase